MTITETTTFGDPSTFGHITGSEITAEHWAEAADILDVAHDVLLHTGVQCGGDHNPYAEPNCTWEAIAIAMDRYDGNDLPAWRSCYDQSRGWEDGPEVLLAVGEALGYFGPSENDHSDEDTVFDIIRTGSKIARERAGQS